MTKPAVRAPAHLSLASRRLFRSVVESYQLEDWHVRLLTTALEAQDTAEEARLRIEQDGPFVATRFGELKSHPAIAVQRDAQAAALRAWKALGLDVESPTNPSPRR